MKELNAKLIVSDFDGTLIDSRHSVPPKVRQAIENYVRDGGIFAVITGRMMASILPQVRALGLKGLVGACQGTEICDIVSGKMIRSGGLTAEQASEACSALERGGYFVVAYSGDRLITDIPADNKYLKQYEKIIQIKAFHPEKPVSQYIAENAIVCQKVASLCFPKDKLKIYDYLVSLFDGKYDITYSAEVLVEISPVGDNKGEALKFLAEHYGVPLEQTVAIGDNLNDLPMIECAGIGVAVENATERLKERADAITLSNDQGAVAQVIAKYGYKA